MSYAKHEVKVSYRASGSGDGIRSVTARTVDFAITDIPLTATDLSNDDFMYFPLIVVAIVSIVNLPIS
jgi:phosphate transport system substrate-binding protein